MAKRTALYDKHVELGGKMVEFCGYDLPVQYGGIMDEHKAVRERAGVFDVSHMARLTIGGKDCLEFVGGLVSNDISTLAIGRIKYALMCNEQGGVRDDVLVYRMDDEVLSLVVNACNADKIRQHISEQKKGDVIIEDRTDATGHIALQGPLSEKIISRLCDAWKLPTKYYSFTDGVELAGVRTFISRNGYTGEDGFEIICDAGDMPNVYTAIIEAGNEEMVPCGLGCRDTLRLEAGMPLYGHELEEDISPLEAGLGIFVKLDKGEFIGREALQKQKNDGIPRKRIGFKMLDRGIAREGVEVYSGDKKIGKVSSGSFCPTLGGNYAMAYVGRNDPLDDLHVEIRGKRLSCEQVAIPFYKKA